MESKRRRMNDLMEASVSLNCLNDDCLLHIFGMLSLKSRIGIERVHPRWKQLCEVIWKQQRTLYICASGFKREFNVIACRTAKQIDGVLQRCGHLLKTLEISCVYDSSTLIIIGEQCPNIEYLTLYGIPTTSHGIQFLAKQCKSIRELHLRSCPGVTDVVLKPLLRNNNTIETLELIWNPEISGKFLKYVPSTIQHISVNGCHSFELQDLVNNINRFQNLLKLNLNDSCKTLDNLFLYFIVDGAPFLHDLSLHGCHLLTSHRLIKKLKNLINLDLSCNSSMNNNALRLISIECDKLESLNISYCLGVTDDGFQQPTNLSNLKSLVMHGLSITDDALTEISTGCLKLELLDVSNCRDITNNGIQQLTNLISLKQLDISYLELIDDEALLSLSSVHTLIILICFHCSLITDLGTNAILHYCESLTHFNVSFCNLVTISTVIKAIKVIKKRPTNVPLELEVVQTAVNRQQIPESLPAKLCISVLN